MAQATDSWLMKQTKSELVKRIRAVERAYDDQVRLRESMQRDLGQCLEAERNKSADACASRDEAARELRTERDRAEVYWRLLRRLA